MPDLSRYANKFDRSSYPAGTTIVEQGDPGTTMYIVVTGEVEVRYDADRSVRLGPGESFGELAIIDRRPRSATVWAVTDTELATISQGTFLVMVQETPYFALEVMQSLADRLRRANRMEA